MIGQRRLLLAGILAAMIAINFAILADVLATVFFAITVATVLLPGMVRLQRRGYRPWVASAIVTAVALVAMVGLVAPILAVVYLRRTQIIASVRAIPEELVFEVGGFSTVVETVEIANLGVAALRSVTIAGAQVLPVLAAKLIVFVFVVYGLVRHREALHRALLAPVPDEQQDILLALGDRIRSVLFALYVTQGATALVTFLVALPVFWLAGYSTPFALAFAAGVLQFLPVVGPSVLILLVAAFEVSQGAVVAAWSLLVVGGIVIAILPDVLVRPRLAQRTANISPSLYFVGFTGGVLSLGAIGIIAGPLAVALLVESLSLLADEIRPERRTTT